MPPSVPESAGGHAPSSTDLPYGPLPARTPVAADPRSSFFDPFAELSRLEAELPSLGGAIDADLDPLAPQDGDPITDESAAFPGGRVHRADAGHTADPDSIGETGPEPSSELEIATGRGEADDDVHFGVAAKALGVSRKTVERMVKRGALERGPSGAQATVSKRALVMMLEVRRRDVGHLTRATAHHGQSSEESLTERWSEDAIGELQELLRPVLEPLLDEFVAARTRAAVLESQLEGIEARAAQERARDELLLALATGSWRERRKARRAALRHYVLRDDLSSHSSS